MEYVYEIIHWFDKRIRRECRAPAARNILRPVFLEKPDAKLEKGNQSVSGAREPDAWKELHAGAEEGVAP